MNRIFLIPFALILIAALFMTLSGNFPVSSCIQLVLIALVVLGVGKKTDYNFTYMWLAGVVALIVFMFLPIILTN